MTLAKALVPSQTLLTRAVMILAGSLFVAIAAQINVPMWPVPMTLQTLAISIIGLTFGSRMAGLTLSAYLAEGAVGLPVFAEFSFGPAVLIGPTAGFLWGFVAMAWLTGILVERGLDKGFVKLFFAAFIPATLLFVPGAAWPLLASKMAWASEWGADSLAMVWQYYVAPFLVGDVVKSAMAALVVTGGWAAMKARKGYGDTL
jgi:biotin transport system substrate-specific component